MPNKRAINLQWPVGGVDRKYQFQKQAPFTCAKANNVWTPNANDRRNTGGSRPGTGKVYTEQLGSGAKVNLLTTVDWASGSGAGQTWGGDFTDQTGWGPTWTQVSSIAATAWDTGAGLPKDSTTVRSGLLNSAGDSVAAVTKGAAYRNIAVNTSAAYSISCFVTLKKIQVGSSCKVRIYARMDSTSPDPASGIYCELIITNGGTYTYTGYLYVNNVLTSTFSGGTLASTKLWGLFKVTINSNTVTAEFDNTAQLGAGTVVSSHGTNVRTALWAQAGGFTSTGKNKFNLIELSGYNVGELSTTNVDVTSTIVAASNGQLYYDNRGAMTAVGSVVLDTGNYLQAVDYQQKLYIANYSYTDAGQVPKIYDPSAGTVSTWTATDGTLPTRCALIARYSDRLVLARQYQNQHLWYMSRKGDPLDWDYTQLALGDNGSAISGANSDASAIGKPITALIPFGDDYMVMGCESELWVMRGDPAFGGQIDNISRNIGIIGGFAWCRTPEGGLLFVASDGLYYLGPGAQMVPETISREKLPNELLNVDLRQVNLTMSYDTENRGAWIFMHAIQGGQSTSWFFDWENKAFWPMTYPGTQEATRSWYVYTPAVRGVLMGCADGYIRKHSSGTTSDDGTALGSYVEIGPIRLAGSEYDEGKLIEIVGTPHYGAGGTVTWTVKAAKNAQALYNAVSGAVDTRTGTWTPSVDGSGLNVKDRQRIRGGAVVVRLEETDSAPWGIESVLATIEASGKQRTSG